MGGHQTADQCGAGAGAADRGGGIRPAEVGEADHRRHRCAGKLPVLDDPGLGRLYDQPEHCPRPGAIHERGGADHGHRVYTPGRAKTFGVAGPDGQRRPDRGGLRVLRPKCGLGATVQGRTHHAVPLPPVKSQQGRKQCLRNGPGAGGRREIQGHDRRPHEEAERERILDGLQGLRSGVCGAGHRRA